MRALFLLVVLGLGACSATKPDSGKLPNPPQRMQQRGFSFLPPAEDNWWIAQKSVDHLTIARVGALDGDSYAIEAATMPVQALASSLERNRTVKAMRERSVQPPRFRIRVHDISEKPMDRGTCALSYMLIEDREPDTGTGTVGSVLVESSSLICAHPDDPATGTVLTYTHRSYPEDQDKVFKARADSILSTLQFSAL